jgi:peptide/nickel transport system substrate-binding protein
MAFRQSEWMSMWIRVILSLVIVFLLFMLYWSQVLQEERLRNIDNSLRKLKSEIGTLKNKVHARGEARELSSGKNIRPYIDQTLPDLLGDDDYFDHVLPHLIKNKRLPCGTLRLATYGKEKDLHPFSNDAQRREWIDYCVPSLGRYAFGRTDKFVHDLALKIELRQGDKEDEACFWVHLREGLMWQPLDPAHFPEGICLSSHFMKPYPLSAYDFEFYVQAFKNPHVDLPGAVATRSVLQNLDRIEVVDDLTFKVFYKKILVQEEGKGPVYKLPYAARQQVLSLTPFPCFVFKYSVDGKKFIEDDADRSIYQKSSYFAQQFVHHFAKSSIPSCGGWVFDGLNDHQIRFRRNGDYFSSDYVLFDAMEIYLLENPEAMFRDFIAGKIDGCPVFPQYLVELENFMRGPVYDKEKEKGNEIQKFNYINRSYGFIAWNNKKPLFADKKVRQALTMAIDRKRMIEQNLNGQGIEITGPFFVGSSANDKTLAPWPYDPDEARRLLQEAGWADIDGDGILEKEHNGKKLLFSFRLSYFVKNPTTKANAELIATQLKKIGVECILNGVEYIDLSMLIDDKSFDAYYLAWTCPYVPDDPDQLWHSRWAKEKGSSNAVGFENKEADSIIEKLKYEDDEEKRIELYHRFHALIREECPYTFLYSSNATFAMWNRVKNVFIPAERKDLIPDAEVLEPSIVHGWKEAGD